MRELEIGMGRAVLPELEDAIDLASDQDEGTWLTVEGKRIAAIVPAAVAENDERMTREILAAPGPLLTAIGGEWHQTVTQDAHQASACSISRCGREPS